MTAATIPTPSGTYFRIAVNGANVKAFMPNKLPPSSDSLDFRSLQRLHDQALVAIGRLAGLPNRFTWGNFITHLYSIREALYSTHIEGTQKPLSDILNPEPPTSYDRVVLERAQTLNCLEALKQGLSAIDEGRPVSIQMLREMHETILAGQGGKGAPGVLRNTQNWIGDPANVKKADFIPSPCTEVDYLLRDMERFIHEGGADLPVLIKIGLIHAQFKTIHPFLDGNGRLGRLLVPLLLCGHEKMIEKPWIYPSHYFKLHRSDYYSKLQMVRTHSAWNPWLEFFLKAILFTTERVLLSAASMENTPNSDQDRIKEQLHKGSIDMKLHELLSLRPFVSAIEI